jgi:hypothetical protein
VQELLLRLGLRLRLRPHGSMVGTSGTSGLSIHITSPCQCREMAPE